MSTETLSRLICGICHDENLQEVGELDSCDHSFCVKCILQWSKIESRCPFCKARFTKVIHKQLDLAALPAPDSGKVTEVFPGAVLEEHLIPERNQRVEIDLDQAAEDPMDDVFCDGCGEGDHEDQIVLCDGCDHGWHTYCAGLEEVPAGEWFCPSCVREGPAAAVRRRARNLAIDEPVSPEMMQRLSQLGQRVMALTGSLRAMRAAAPGAAQAAEVAERAAGTHSRRRGTRRVSIRRHELRPDGAVILRTGEEVVSDNSGSSSEEETTSESSPERRPEAARRSLRRRREEHPDDVDYREYTPNQRLPTPRRARPRTRTGSAPAARQTESARPHRRRRTEQSAPQAASADASLLPSRAHRNVEELRARWEAIRQGQVDFGGQPTAAQVNEEDSSDDDETSEEESGGSQDMPLSDRFTAIARAREALERNRHLQSVNQARRTGQPQTPEQRRQAAFSNFSAARAEFLRRRQLHRASARPHLEREREQAARMASRQQGAHAAPARQAVPSRASILAQQLMDNERRPSVARNSRLAAARASQQEGQVHSPKQQAAKPSAPIRPPEGGGSAHRSPGRRDGGSASHNTAEGLAKEGRKSAEAESTRGIHPSPAAIPVVSADSEAKQRREGLMQVAEAAKEKLTQARPISAEESGRASAVTLQRLPSEAARTGSGQRAERRDEGALGAPSLAPRGPQPLVARPIDPSVLSRWQRRPFQGWENLSSAANISNGRTAGAAPGGAPQNGSTPNWQWGTPGSGVQPPAGWQPPPYSGRAGSSGPPWLTHPVSQPPASPVSPFMPPPPSAATAFGALTSGAQQSGRSRSRGDPAHRSAENSRGAVQAQLSPQESSREVARAAGAVSGVGGSRLSERTSESDSDTSGNSSPGKFEPVRRANPELALMSSEVSQAEESARLKEKKNSAYRAVKALLDPLYKKGRLTSEEYKQAARDATHRLYKGNSEPSEPDWQADAEKAVKKVMKRSRK